MILDLNDIVDASKCFRYFNLKKTNGIKSSKLKTNTTIIKQVISDSYHYILKNDNKNRVDWRILSGWSDTLVFKDIDVTDKKEYKAARSQSEVLLTFLRKWWKEVYLEEHIIPYINLPIDINTEYFQVVTKLPIVRIGEEYPALLYFFDEAPTTRDVFNNLEIRAHQWMLSEFLEVPNVRADVVAIGTNGGYSITTTFATKPDHDRTRENIEQIGNGIVAGLTFPTITKLCRECPFYKKCNL